jgi:TonB family protein
MRLSAASSALTAVFLLAPVAAGYAPALCQDFSITNQAEPTTPGRRDVMRQLQAWWDAHAYYPRHASRRDESGTVEVHLVILPDGKVWTIDVVEGSGSPTIDAAAEAVFRGAFVRPFPAGEPQAEMDISLHYVLAHRHDQPAAAGYTPAVSKSPFTITNDPVTSPILATMLQKICTGTITLGGIPNHPLFGVHYRAQAIFFRKPDGTPWVKFYEGGHASLSPVTEIGKMVTWAGRQQHNGYGAGDGGGDNSWFQYTVWPDGDNHLTGAIGGRVSRFGIASNSNLAGNSVDLACATEVEPTVTWNDVITEQNKSIAISPFNLTPIDPP